MSAAPQQLCPPVQLLIRRLCSKYKIPDFQDGHAYLTSHRACYVDNKEPRKFSVAVNLKDVERPEFYVCPRECRRWQNR